MNTKTIFKKMISVVTTIGIITGLLSVTGCNNKGDPLPPVKEIPEGKETVPVKIMTREGHDWEGFFESPTIYIDGDGEYSSIIKVEGNPTIIPMLIISSVGTDTTDNVMDEAVKIPLEYWRANVTVNSLKVNDDELTLINNENIPLMPTNGKLKNFFNVQIWNAWYKPSQRVVTNNDNIIASENDGEALKFRRAVKTIEVRFTVNGVKNVEDVDPNEFTEEVTEPSTKSSPSDRSPKNVVISGEFDTSKTSKQLVEDITLGWNLGNTLDAYNSSNPSEKMEWVNYDNMNEIETAWIGGTENITTQSLITKIKKAGFNAIRIPITWHELIEDENEFTISPKWLDHVQLIVNLAVAEDMYIIINTHHDEYLMRFDEDPAVGERAIKSLWNQIATRFKDYNEKLIFEGLNEPRARTNEWNTRGNWDWTGDETKYQTINRWNQAFVNAVRETGGNNNKRHLMLAVYGGQHGQKQLDGFELPTDPVAENGKDKFILSVHSYSPSDWAHNGNGSYSDDTKLRTDLERVANKAASLDIPVILGEWGSVNKNQHNERVKHAGDYIRIATEMRNRETNPVTIACFWWDNNGDFGVFSRSGDDSKEGLEIIGAMNNSRNGNTEEETTSEPTSETELPLAS